MGLKINQKQLNILLVSQDNSIAEHVYKKLVLSKHYLAVFDKTSLPLSVFFGDFYEAEEIFDVIVFCGGKIADAFNRLKVSVSTFASSNLRKIAVVSDVTSIVSRNSFFVKTFEIIDSCADIEKTLSTLLQRGKYLSFSNKTGLVDYKIQNLMFPDCAWKFEHWWMMYRGDKLAYEETTRTWKLLADRRIECFSYFNGLTVKKWDNYTMTSGYKLHLKIKGTFRFNFFGQRLESGKGGKNLNDQLDEVRALDVADVQKRKFLHQLIHKSKLVAETSTPKEYTGDGENEIIIPAIYNDVDILSFKIVAVGDITIYGGYWSAIVEKAAIRTVNISLCTTTFKKEDFILPNLKLINDEIFECRQKDGMDGLSEHLYVNVVDNGKTLDRRDVDRKNIRLHPNPNVGGAGGFSRGMMETVALRERGEFDATHVLFMDDDVNVLPESIKRTYALLCLLKPEHQDRFISGAMLDINQMNEQYEDLGYLSLATSSYLPIKPRLFLHLPEDVIRNEQNYGIENMYAAWWYCVVPIKFVSRDTLSYPIFYRNDDIDFSLRNNAEFITMNGICIWHMTFNTKIAPSLEYYLVLRNSMITQALDNTTPEINFINRIKFLYGEEIRKFNYGSCDQLLDAVEGFLNGPEYIVSLPFDYVIKHQANKNEKLLPLNTFGNVDVSKVYEYVCLKKSDQDLFIRTDNGHTLPDELLRDECPAISFLFFESPGKQFLCKQILAVDVPNQKAVIHKMDRVKWRQLTERRDKLLALWERDIDKIREQYRQAAPRLRSAEFWQEYLGL